jgi:hypothetical protein
MHVRSGTPRTVRRPGPAAFALGVYWLTVALSSSLAGAGVFSASSFASSPLRIEAGKFWLLFTNALVCAPPRGASFFALVLFGLVTLYVCGSRILWTAAALGHVFSTLCVYSMIAVTRFFDSSAFDHVLGGRDVGVSAICAAWLGAVASTQWRVPGRTRNGKIAVTGTVAAIGGIAYVVNPHLTVLDSDHVFAFAIGAAVALVPVRALVKADAVYSFSAAAYSRVRTLVVAAARAAFARPAPARRRS